MFTGLIEEKGIIKKNSPSGKGRIFEISAKKVMDDLKIGDSININGACQTVISLTNNSFTVESVEETLKKTNFGSFVLNQKVNLERSMKIGDRLGGHFVLGHVDTTGKIISVEELTNSRLIKISFSPEYFNNLIPVGSIAVDGISLTLAEVNKEYFSVAIIPHTWNETNFAEKKIGDTVNLEFDMLGKYILKQIPSESSAGITKEFLTKHGF